MSRYAGSKSAPRSGPSQVWAGIFVGVVIGAGIAAVFSWYMMKTPSPLRQPVVTPPPVAVSPAPPAQTASEKPRFEFYNVLTEKAQKSAAPAKQTNQEKQVAQSKPSEIKPAETKPVAAYMPQILQVGSFSTAVDAEKLKARLAMIGAESHIQTANVPDRGVYYRVRLGPYKSEEELNRARSFLKQNDLESTPMRAQ